MRLHFSDAAVLGSAAITHQRIANQRKEQQVGKGRGEEDSERPSQTCVVPRNGTAKDADCYQQYPQALRKILSNVQIIAGTDQTTRNAAPFDRSHRQFDLLLAMRAAKRRRRFVEVLA